MVVYQRIKGEAKSLKEEIEASERVVLKFSFDDIKAFLGLFSILFLCSGVFYNQLFLGYFGIEVSKFYNLSDYIDTSIDKIYDAIIGITVGIIIGNIMIAPVKFKKRPGEFKPPTWPWIIITISFSVLVIYQFIKGSPERFLTLSLLLIMWFSYIYAKSLRKYLDIPPYLNQFIIITVIFVFNFWAITMRERENIVKRDLNEMKKYEIYFSQDIGVDQTNLIILTANSNYYFFYDKKENKAIIIPIKYIKYIEVIKRKK